ncbi:MAG: pilus assembly protein PilM [Gammaproteobacteria bacterium]|nr:pilus assembly protein PilM [Gammaproteobacteria bacterium]
MEIKNILLGREDKAANLLGIDIGRNFIRLVELSRQKDRYRVESCVSKVFDKPLVSDEMIIAGIQRLLKHALPKTKAAAIAFPHDRVIFKEIDIAADLSSDKINDFLRFNLGGDKGEAQDDLGFDYQIIDRGDDPDISAKLQLVAVQKEQIKKWDELLKVAGLVPEIIDVDVYALERAVRYQIKQVQGLVAVINIDYGRMLIVVLSKDKIVYVYEDFIDEIDLNSVARIMDQINSKLQLIYSSILGSLERLILGGELAFLPGLIDELGAKLNIQAEAANPFLGMDLSSCVSFESLCQISPLMLVSCGLALRVDGYGGD